MIFVVVVVVDVGVALKAYQRKPSVVVAVVAADQTEGIVQFVAVLVVVVVAVVVAFVVVAFVVAVAA